MHQELDGPFTAIQLAPNLGQLSLRSIVQVDRLSGTGPELFETFGQRPDHIVGIRPQSVWWEHRFQFEAQFRPGHFFASFDFANVLAQEIASDPQ